MPRLVIVGFGEDGATNSTYSLTGGYGGPGPEIGACLPLVVDTLTPGPYYIDLKFSAILNPLELQAADPSFWVITSLGSGVDLTVFSVEITSPDTIRLATNEATDGQNYSLKMPLNGLKTEDEEPYDGDENLPFVAGATPPTAVNAVAIDSTHVRVIFSEVVVEAGALEVTNYVIDNGLVAVSVSKEAPTQYILETSKQTAGVSYTITVSNITDEALNPI